MRTLRLPAAVVALCAAAALAACTNGGGNGGGDETLDLTGNWALVSGTTSRGDIELTDADEVTLNVEEDGVANGRSACNTYATEVTVEGDSVTFAPLASTLMACEDRVMVIEASYHEALAAVEAGSRSGDTLTLTGADTELVFEPAE